MILSLHKLLLEKSAYKIIIHFSSLNSKDIEKYVHIKYKEVSLLLSFNYCLRFTFCNIKKLEWFALIHYSAFFGSEGHVALDRNPGSEYDTLLLRMIPGDPLSAFPHRQFHTLPGL